MSLPATWHSEEALHQATGIAQKKLLKTRMKKLTKGADWDYHAGNAVMYSKNGVARLLEALGLRDNVHLDKLADDTQAPPPEAPAAPKKPALEATVRRLVLNPHLLLANLEDGTEIRVRVRSSANFKPHMRIPVELRPGGGDVYTLTRKEPRFPGKW